MFATWHEDHVAARRLAGRPLALPAHVALETFSVLTRLPEPHRMAPSIVAEWLRRQFPVILDPPTGADHLALVGRLAKAGLSGGAVYDALVGETCRKHGLELCSQDLRAGRAYEAVGVVVRPLP